MILIDQDTDARLLARLEKIRAEGESCRCIYFDLKENNRSGNMRETVIAAARAYLPAEKTQVYVCEDEEIFILAPIISGKDSHELIAQVALRLGKKPSDEWVRFVELPLQINPLLIAVDAKVEKQRRAQEIKRRLTEQQQAERKRQTILNMGVSAKQEEISSRRAARKTAELMIIEDDAFSRRLVENVLQKKYPLTGLGEASRALDTYARLAPDLLFLDINLPDVTGHELLERILALDPEAYVIMLSGNADRENITQAMSKGAKGFIAKPFTKDKLFQYIERCPTLALKQRSDSAS